MHISKCADVVICDGGSTDGSMSDENMKAYKVNTLLIKTDKGKQGAQLRMGFWWALERGYKGIITIDGNNKDINAGQIISYIVRGAKMRTGDSYPNREWGYGTIDVNRIFNSIRGEYYDGRRGLNENEYEIGNLFIREPNKV